MERRTQSSPAGTPPARRGSCRWESGGLPGVSVPVGRVLPHDLGRGAKTRRRRLRIPHWTAFPRKLHAPLGAAKDFGEGGAKKLEISIPGPSSALAFGPPPSTHSRKEPEAEGRVHSQRIPSGVWGTLLVAGPDAVSAQQTSLGFPFSPFTDQQAREM